jgi:hypothetical protein
MSHSVHFRDAAGNVHLEDIGTLEAALERVEGLRNDDDVAEVRVFREVPIEVRTYYRVVAVDESAALPAVETLAVAEAPGPEPAVSAPVAVLEAPSGAMMMSPTPVAAVPDVAPEDVEVPADTGAGEHRRQLFSRS